MTILRDLLRRAPFPIKFRIAKALFKLVPPGIRGLRPLGRFATPPDTASKLDSRKDRGLEVLVVLDRLPLPTKDAARVRMLAILKILTRFAGVVLILLYHKFENSNYEQSIKNLGIDLVGVFDFEDFLSERRFDVALISYPYVTEYMLPIVKHRFPDAKVIFDTVDVHFVRLEREATVKRIRRIAAEARKLRQIETMLANTADQTWCVTEDDRGSLGSEATTADIRVVPNVHEVQDGGPSFEERSDLLFIGNFEHRPNVDAGNLLIDEILPLLLAELPGLKLNVVGGNLTSAMLARSSPDLVFHGFLEDIGPIFRKCRVFVAPLRFGGGMKGKVGEALSFGVPVVTTSTGAEGFGLMDGHDVVIADDISS